MPARPPAAIRVLPSGLKRTVLTGPGWSASVVRGLPVATSKSTTLRPTAAARIDPSGENVSDVTGSAAAFASLTFGRSRSGSTSDASGVEVSEGPSNLGAPVRSRFRACGSPCQRAAEACRASWARRPFWIDSIKALASGSPGAEDLRTGPLAPLFKSANVVILSPFAAFFSLWQPRHFRTRIGADLIAEAYWFRGLSGREGGARESCQEKDQGSVDHR